MKVEWQKIGEASDSNWSVRVGEIKVEKDSGGAEAKVYSFSLGEKSVAVSVTEDGKLKRVIINESEVVEENESVVKQKANTLVFDYEGQKVTLNEGEIEVEKKPNGMKSLKVIKSEARTFSLKQAELNSAAPRP